MADKFINVSGLSRFWNRIKSYIDDGDSGKQDTLVSGSNIKTVNNISLLGSGNIDISGGEGGSDVFVIIPEETTYEEILNAVNAGNVIIVERQASSGAIARYPCNIYSDSSEIRVVALIYNAESHETYLYPGETVPAWGSWSDYSPLGFYGEGNWRFRINKPSMYFEAWYKATSQSITITSGSGNLYRSELRTLTLPSLVGTPEIIHAEVNASHNNYPTWGMLASLSGEKVNYYACSGGSRSNSPNYTVTAYVFGTLS